MEMSYDSSNNATGDPVDWNKLSPAPAVQPRSASRLP